MTDNDALPKVETNLDKMRERPHDDDTSEGVQEPWTDEQELVADSVDKDYPKSTAQFNSAPLLDRI